MDGNRTPGFIGTAASIRDCGLSDAGQGNETDAVVFSDCTNCGRPTDEPNADGECIACAELRIMRERGICEECE